MSEEEAKTKKCPFFTPNPDGNCVADKCMAWEYEAPTYHECCGAVLSGKCINCGANYIGKLDGLICNRKIQSNKGSGYCKRLSNE